MYSLKLDGFYTGKPKEYRGCFSLPRYEQFHIYENGELLISLPISVKLNEHYTQPDRMPYYNLATILIQHGKRT